MKHHATLCDDVALEESDPIWLHALRDVFDTISICGTVACEQRIVNAIEFMLGKGLFVRARDVQRKHVHPHARVHPVLPHVYFPGGIYDQTLRNAARPYAFG